MDRQDFIKKGTVLSIGLIGSTSIVKAAKPVPLVSENTAPIFRSPSEGKTYQLPDMKITVKFSDDDNDGVFGIFEEETAPGIGPPLHTHKEQWEIFEIIEGKYKIQINDTIYTAEVGSLALIPPNTPHCFVNINDTTSKLRFILSPSLNFEGFIKEMSQFKEMPNPKKLTGILEKYGMSLVGPPINID